MLHNAYLAPWQPEQFYDIRLNWDGKLASAQFHRSHIGRLGEEGAQMTLYLRDSDASPHAIFLHPVRFSEVSKDRLGEAILITEQLYSKIGERLKRNSELEDADRAPPGFV